MIRHQYAARHPHAEDPTVRFNDFAFALHAVVLSFITYTQFWPFIWGFKVSRHQKVSKPVAGLFWGSIVGVTIVIFIVLGQSPNNGFDPYSWAWIDVVSSPKICKWLTRMCSDPWLLCQFRYMPFLT